MGSKNFLSFYSFIQFVDPTGYGGTQSIRISRTNGTNIYSSFELQTGIIL
jgi:hypothetical protein